MAGVLALIGLLVVSYWLAWALPASQGGIFAAAATAFATMVLAALTAILLQLNASTLGEMRQATEATRRATEATVAAAQATEREARATEASNGTLREQIEREWRPLLLLSSLPDLRALDELGERQTDVKLVNLGRGPAVNVLVCLWKELPPEVIWRWGPVHVGAGQALEVTVFKSDDQRNDMFDFDPPRSHEAIICEDQSGSWHRFSRNNPVPDSYYGPTSRLDSWVSFYATALNSLPPPR